ncbi:hypothetical protein [Sphaerimonospora thailandensis]|uniref:Uncharacterized protein n=1 Tax=Sphaerimonospora thailandensis TaxID=795644 RepID=A0A8J3VZC5_9ACTN|nr:hypothetical protein [Sphaerimonospora thailandensis]GIH70352.1 hypothetical protein Mth01_26050 [Sphaerimonospora thailandensis]
MAWSKSGLMYQAQIDQWDPSSLGLDLTAEDWKCPFFGSAVTPDFTADLGYGTAPWDAGEAAGAGYTAGGPLLSSTTLAIVGNQMVWDADNVELTASTIQAEGALLYSPPKGGRALAAVWFGAPRETQDGTFLITWASGGIAAFTIP